MLLRNTIEKHLPPHEGEQKLSPEASAIVYRGKYLLGSKVVGVACGLTRYSPPDMIYDNAYETSVQRQTKTGHLFVGGYRLNAPRPAQEIEELQESESLERVNRVESVARAVKISGVSAIATLAVIAYETGIVDQLS